MLMQMLWKISSECKLGFKAVQDERHLLSGNMSWCVIARDLDQQMTLYPSRGYATQSLT